MVFRIPAGGARAFTRTHTAVNCKHQQTAGGVSLCKVHCLLVFIARVVATSIAMVLDGASHHNEFVFGVDPRMTGGELLPVVLGRRCKVSSPLEYTTSTSRVVR